MNNEIDISSKFEPLFQLLDSDSLKEVDTVILTGGRASGKSFALAIFSLIGLVSHGWKVLYSRFTNTSIGDSIKEEVSSKIELLNFDTYVDDKQYEITSSNGAKIAFKGIKTGSKGQTANLKSLSGFNCFIVDEAEEIPSFETFKKVFYSIRSSDLRNISILILNPTTKEHWIYQRFFEKQGIPDGFCGVVGNVLYIHTSYKDVNPKYIPENIKRDYERMQVEEPTEYDNVVLGGWITEPTGVLFSRKSLNYFTELPKEEPIAKLAFIDPADSGKDAHSVPVGYLYPNGSCYIEEVVYTTEPVESNVQQTADILNKHIPQYTRVEINMGGGMYPMLLEPKLDKRIMLLKVREKSSKHERIYTASGFIKRFCYFRSDYAHGSQYYEFMKILCNYLADGSADHDDAPDSLAGLVTMINQFYPNLYQGK